MANSNTVEDCLVFFSPLGARQKRNHDVAERPVPTVKQGRLFSVPR